MPFGEDCWANPSIEAISSSGTFGAGTCQEPSNGFAIPTLYDFVHAETIGLPFPADTPEDASATGNGVNDDGIVVGILNYEGELNRRSFVYRDGETVEVPNAIGGSDIGLVGLNNHGLAVAGSEDSGGETTAISYNVHTGVTTILGPGSAKDVNEGGQACGNDLLDFGIAHPVAYIDGETIYLDEYMPDELLFWGGANAINNYGWIVGDAEDGENISTYVGWLLVPIYEKGDYDGDEDVDLHDFGHFQECFAAEPYIDGSLHVGCSVFDFDDDIDLDLTDYQSFQAAFTGAITSGW